MEQSICKLKLEHLHSARGPSQARPGHLRCPSTHLQHSGLRRDVPSQDRPEGLISEIPLILRRSGAKLSEIPVFPVIALSVTRRRGQVLWGHNQRRAVTSDIQASRSPCAGASSQQCPIPEVITKPTQTRRRMARRSQCAPHSQASDCWLTSPGWSRDRRR
jgi:hypothetical protein